MLSGSLTRPAPELVQALVEHLACVLRRPDRVERCVLHFDIMALDLDQVGAGRGAGPIRATYPASKMMSGHGMGQAWVGVGHGFGAGAGAV